VQTGVSTLPEVTTTIALHKTGNLMKLLVSVEALYGDDDKIWAIEATFYPPYERA
jgi:hypothetical protein